MGAKPNRGGKVTEIYQTRVAAAAGCVCQGCGQNYTLDVSVTDEIWEQIKPQDKPKGAGLLCPQCIVSRLIFFRLGDKVPAASGVQEFSVRAGAKWVPFPVEEEGA